MTARRAALVLARSFLVAVGVVGSAFALTAGLADHRLSDALSLLVPVAAFSSVGLLVSVRLPRNAVGWLFLGTAATAGLIGLGNALMAHALSTGQTSAWWALTAAWAANFLWVIVVALGFPLTLLLFPHGLPSRRWRPLLAVTVLSTAMVVALGMVTPTLTIGDGGPVVANPLNPTAWGSWVHAAWTAALLILSICSFASVGAALRRYLRGEGVERAQMRWLAFSSAIVIVVLFIPGLNNSNVGFAIGFSLVPVSCGIAILRYRLYEIDRIISRTTSYAVVTALVLGTYAAVVTAVLRALPEASSLAVATATLAAAAVARPAVTRVQRVVDRRFDRTRYDQVRTAEAFGDQVRHLVDPADVTTELRRTVVTALQPKTADVWSGSRP